MPERATTKPSEIEMTDLEQLLDRLDEAAEGEETVSLGRLLDAVGRRSFGPLLVFAGMVAVSPLSGIPGLPTTLGLIVILITAQLLLKRKHFWLPEWTLRRSIARSKLERAVRFLRKPARGIDRVLRPRLCGLTNGPATYGIAALCLLIAATMPPLEVVPFAASAAGAALTMFGLALISRDGLIALAAFSFTGLTAALAVMSLAGD